MNGIGEAPVTQRCTVRRSIRNNRATSLARMSAGNFFSTGLRSLVMCGRMPQRQEGVKGR